MLNSPRTLYIHTQWFCDLKRNHIKLNKTMAWSVQGSPQTVKPVIMLLQLLQLKKQQVSPIGRFWLGESGCHLDGSEFRASSVWGDNHWSSSALLHLNRPWQRVVCNQPLVWEEMFDKNNSGVHGRIEVFLANQFEPCFWRVPLLIKFRPIIVKLF